MSYMETFELPAGSACPLYTGIYARQRKEAMEELLRFYRHFGLTLSEDPRDLPDSVPTVLEFLQFLAWRQGREDAAAAASLQAAERDVIQRHLLPWAQTTDQRLAERSGEFYPRLVQLLASVCEARLS
jgi:DMSO reductase family type II enzyme chaperone